MRKSSDSGGEEKPWCQHGDCFFFGKPFRRHKHQFLHISSEVLSSSTGFPLMGLWTIGHTYEQSIFILKRSHILLKNFRSRVTKLRINWWSRTAIHAINMDTKTQTKIDRFLKDRLAAMTQQKRVGVGGANRRHAQ